MQNPAVAMFNLKFCEIVSKLDVTVHSHERSSLSTVTPTLAVIFLGVKWCLTVA